MLSLLGRTPIIIISIKSIIWLSDHPEEQYSLTLLDGGFACGWQLRKNHYGVFISMSCILQQRRYLIYRFMEVHIMKKREHAWLLVIK